MSPIAALALGVWAGTRINFTMTEDMALFLAMGLIIALDLLFEGMAQYLNHCFQLRGILINFLLNVVFAYFLLTVGYLMHVDLYIALFIVFGIKMFSNLSYISQKFFSKMPF